MKRNIRCALVAMFAIVCAMVQAQDSEKMVYPQAEWSKAGDILMHTPGQELFNGVIHPSAGLFEDYFDVDKAADEHVGYIEMLEKNGIRVHTVMEILQEVGIDSLRELASNVLVYDISSIPDEDATAMENYRQDVLQKMSRNDLIRCILLQPTVKLSRTDNNTGYEAQYIQNPLMNLYFTRDQSITTPRGHIIFKSSSFATTTSDSSPSSASRATADLRAATICLQATCRSSAAVCVPTTRVSDRCLRPMPSATTP